MEEVPIRYVQVTGVKRITPRMARITFGGDDLAGFTYDEPDQQVKLYFPKPGQTVPRLPEPNAYGDFMGWYQAYNAIPQPERPWMRSYTIRAHHPQPDTIDIDFVLHDDAGPATQWAQSAEPGDTLGMFGPSAMFARPGRHPDPGHRRRQRQGRHARGDGTAATGRPGRQSEGRRPGLSLRDAQRIHHRHRAAHRRRPSPGVTPKTPPGCS
jgi:NADPH-dependent ferric siderophore reductase